MMINLTPKQTERLRRQLLADREALEARLAASDHYDLAHSMRDSIGELSFYDNHPADIGSEVFERGKDVALNENSERALAETNAALDAIEAGTYGICKVCGEPIGYARLEAVPSTAYCIEHVPERHVAQNRPIEEEILREPFGRTSFDKLDGNTEWNEFDGEDAWQAVNEWGTSNSPAMAEDPEALSYNNLYIESDENVGYVEPLESFLATDLAGRNRMVVRNNEYRKYLDRGEGEALLEFDMPEDDEGWYGV